MVEILQTLLDGIVQIFCGLVADVVVRAEDIPLIMIVLRLRTVRQQ